MSRIIADILDADLVKFRHSLDEWDRKSGVNSNDNAVYSDMRARAVSAIKKLGLDPSDTISGELYFALQERAKHDNLWLASSIGISDGDSPSKAIKKVIKWILSKSDNLEVWEIKPGVIRSYLKKQPPKATMKALGLRSIDSMLKRNDPHEILTIAYELEKPEWIKRFRSQYKKLSPADFDVIKIKPVVVDGDRVKKLKKTQFPINRLISPNYETGGLVIVPNDYRFPLDVLALVVAISESIFEIRKHSALYRVLSVRPDFGVIFARLCQDGINKTTSDISEIGWNSIHRHLVGNDYLLSKIEQPHVSRADLWSESTVDFLSKHDDRFKYWQDLEFVFYHDAGNQPISLNLLDVVLSASNKAPFGEGYMQYGRMKLWEEIWARYLTSDDVVDDVIGSYLS